MPAKWVGFLIFIWVIAILLGSVPQGEVLANNETVSDPVQGLLSYTQVWSQQSWGSQLVYPIMHPEWLGDLFDLLLLNVPLFGDSDSPFQIVRWIVVAPILGTMVFGLVMLFISIFQRTV